MFLAAVLRMQQLLRVAFFYLLAAHRIAFTGIQLPIAFGNIVIDNCNVNNCLGNAAIAIYFGVIQ